MSEERVQLTIDNHVATVRMSRPEKRNALDAAMFDGLIRMGKRIIADKSVRAVVLHGEGKAFCAGLDFGSFLGSPELMQKLLSRREESPANMAQRAGWIWQEVKVPVIAAVHGFAFGGGLQIALGADIPVIYGVLTSDTVEQAMDRAGAKGGNKGWDAALSAIEMVNLFQQLRQITVSGGSGKDSDGAAVCLGRDPSGIPLF